MTVRRLGVSALDSAVDYPHTPHLTQWPLRHRLVVLLLDSLKEVSRPGVPTRVLEIGAGHGGYTEPLLAAGCAVTAIDMSATAADRLHSRLGTNERLTCIVDRDASLSQAQGEFSLAVAVSVLHHIPDYLAFLDRVLGHLAPGGVLVTVQDPLWYPRVGRLTYTIDRGAYLGWRLAQGNVRDGVSAMRRRWRGEFPEPAGDDIGYYHVVRQGVDENAVVTALQSRFARVDLFSYWSNHLGAVRMAAERAKLANTFALRAAGLRSGQLNS